MTYYCNSCRKLTDLDDLTQQPDGGTGETITCCPWCGGNDLDEAEPCEQCGKVCFDGEIYGGLCLDCTREAIDYDTALDFIKRDRYGGLAQFILNEWFDATFEEGLIQGGSSDKLDAFLEETFRRLAADEKLRLAVNKTDPPRFLEACRDYCLPYYRNGDFGSEGQDFAEWFAEYRKRKK